MAQPAPVAHEPTDQLVAFCIDGRFPPAGWRLVAFRCSQLQLQLHLHLRSAWWPPGPAPSSVNPRALDNINHADSSTQATPRPAPGVVRLTCKRKRDIYM